jgi:hypothetical protein
MKPRTKTGSLPKLQAEKQGRVTLGGSQGAKKAFKMKFIKGIKVIF